MSLSTKRILVDLLDLMDDPLPDTFLYFKEEDIREVWIGIVGQPETPYEGGFFFFHVHFTNKYPSEPPKLTFLNPNEKIRFHPNLYETGKVCLSILGTWAGPEWTSVMTLRSLILSLQSLLSEDPLRHEPGLDFENNQSKRNQTYNEVIRYSTTMYAINGTLQYFQIPALQAVARKYVSEHYQTYENIISHLPLDKPSQSLRTMYGMKVYVDYHSLYNTLLRTLEALQPKEEKTNEKV